MYTTTALYRRLLSDANHKKEVRANIAGVEYSQDDIRSCALSGGMFSEIAVGQCVAKELDLIVQPKGVVPRMAQIKLFIRLTLGEEYSEWVPKGVYYIDTRSADEVSGTMTVHAYDAMLKAEQIYLPEGDTGEWPRPQQTVVNEICIRMGAGLDSRTVINPAYQVEFPNDFTMREILGYVASSHGGNWIMTDEGKLLLAPLGGLPPETSFLIDCADGGAILFGEVRILV